MRLQGTITGFRQHRALDNGTVQISCPISGAKITIEADVSFCRKLVEHYGITNEITMEVPGFNEDCLPEKEVAL
jgi:hypothetical protein